MNHVLLAVKSSDILAQLTALHIWGEETEFEIATVCGNIKELVSTITSQRFDLLLIETSIAKSDSYQSIKKIKSCNLCRHIAFCGHEGDFDCAREGILLGVSEYYTLPFDRSSFISLFDRIKAEKQANQVNVDKLAETLASYFVKQDAGIYDYLDHLSKNAVFPQILDTALQKIFEQHDWLDLYFNEDYYYALSVFDQTEHKNRFCQLYESSRMLNPHHNESFHDAILFILYNPENDLRQKVLSEKFHLNKSYLSTIFTAQTGLRFVDYITYVKMMRAAWLLRNADLKISEVAERMDYKDIAYFSKLFKRHFNMTPSEYKIPDNYQFQI